MADEKQRRGDAPGRARPQALELPVADDAQRLPEVLEATPTWGLARPELLQLLERCPEQLTGYEIMTVWYGIAAGRVTEDEVRARCPKVMTEIEELRKDLAELATLAGEKLTEYTVRAYAAFGSVVEGGRASAQHMREQLAAAVATLSGPPAEVRLLQAVRDETNRQAEILIESGQQIALLAESGRAALDGLRALEGLAGATVKAIEHGQESADRAAARLTKLTWALVALTGFLGLLTLVLVVLTVVLVAGAR
jgi:hypothetical protein